MLSMFPNQIVFFDDRVDLIALTSVFVQVFEMIMRFNFG
jgi:hypothetical protein